MSKPVKAFEYRQDPSPRSCNCSTPELMMPYYIPQQSVVTLPSPWTCSPSSKQVEKAQVGKQRAIDFLVANDKSICDVDGNPVPEADKLVLEEDKPLLTDYFYHVMKQLSLVRFSEDDRKVRGGARDKIKVGYGGLQCVHCCCAGAPKPRKFFWSNVDRLANSFAEIPGHLLKCRHCPQPIKDSLLQLKLSHPKQMTKLQRGSQKVFLRRLWRRVHSDQIQASEVIESLPLRVSTSKHQKRDGVFVSEQNDKQSGCQDSQDGASDSSSEISTFLELSTNEAAHALANSSVQEGPPSPSSRVLLAVSEDQSWLSERDCFIRRQLEVFCASKEDVENASANRRYIREGQVGIRCIHCQGRGMACQAISFPSRVSDIYEYVRLFQIIHLEFCDELPPTTKSKLSELKGCSSLSSVLRKYYVLAANALGLQDTREGIRASGESIPLGSEAILAFTEVASNASRKMQHLPEGLSSEGYAQILSPVKRISRAPLIEENRKRGPPEEAEGSGDFKRTYVEIKGHKKLKSSATEMQISPFFDHGFPREMQSTATLFPSSSMFLSTATQSRKFR